MSTIKAGTTTGTALVTEGDTTGQLVFQTNGTTTALTIGTNQTATFSGNVAVNGTLTASGGLPSLATPLAVVGNATAGSEIRLPEDTDNGSNYVALKAPNALASNTTWTLPTADGTNGQYIQTNGSGQLAFATVPTTSPAGSTGQLQVNNAGAFGAVASGTSGQVLTSNGAGVAPSFTTVASSPVVLIASATLSTSAAQFLLNNIPVTSYSSIIIEFMVRPDSNTSVAFGFVTPGGTTDAGQIYGRWTEGRSNNAGGNSFGVNGNSAWFLNPSTTSGSSSEIGVILNVQQTNQTTTKRGFTVQGFGDTNASVGYSSYGGGYSNSSSWGGIRIYPGSGNFLAGSYYRIYGVL
jgi:hypothetical protein